MTEGATDARESYESQIGQISQQPTGPSTGIGGEVQHEGSQGNTQGTQGNPFSEAFQQVWDTMQSGMQQAMQSWQNQPQPVEGQGGYVAYIEPETGAFALPEEWNDSSHPILKSDTTPEIAKRLAAEEAKRSVKKVQTESNIARQSARKAADEAKGKRGPVKPKAAEVAADEALSAMTSSVPHAADVVAAANPAVMEAERSQTAPETPPVSPQLTPKFSASEDAVAQAVDESIAYQGAGQPNLQQEFSEEEPITQETDEEQQQGQPQFRQKFRAEEPTGSDGGAQGYQASRSGGQQARSQQQSQQSQQGQQRQQGQQAQAQQAAAPNTQQSAAAQAVDQELSERDLIQQIKVQEAREATKDARRRANAEFKEWRKRNPNAPASEFVASDAEAFDKSLGSAMKEHWGEPGEEPDNLPGRAERDETRKWRLLDRVNFAFQIGFFHIGSEKLKYDKDGNPKITYSLPVTRVMEEMQQVFGLSGAKGNRTIFRLVTMYASLSVDRHGKMFNEDANEWSMSDDDFIRICRLIMDSARNNHGNPMVMPHRSEKLGGTEIYPAGVMPRVVAQVLINPNNTTIPGNMQAGDLVQICQDEWTRNTYPRMQARLAEGMKPPKKRGRKKGDDKQEEYKQNLTAQKIVVENFNEALSRLDGMKLEDFSARYRVDTSMHYRLEEYKDANKLYAQAMNGNYDADMVMRREKAKEDAWDKRMKPGRYRTVKHADGTVEVAGVKHQTSIGAGMRLTTKLIKANALFANIPVMVGNIAEHGVGNLQTNITLHAMLGRRSRYKMSDAAKERLQSDEFVEAMSAVKLMMELLGPGGCRLFAKEKLPYTTEAVIKFARENYMPDSSSTRMRDAETWISQAVDKVMTGDIGFKKSDNVNWWLGLIVSNDRRARRQERLEDANKVDRYGISFSPEELEDMLLHQQPEQFLTTMMGDDTGIDGYLLMRGNNVGNINLVSYNVQQTLNRHAVTEGVITMFVDNFPKYGVNLLMSMVPFSKTVTYLAAKRSGNENIATDTDLVIGGNIGELGGITSTGKFWEDEALRMNLWYDGIMFARQAIVMPCILGFVMAFLGYEPPDDKRNLFNPSMWKVGGEEFHLSYWTNDITLWSLPIAHLIAYNLSKDRIEENYPEIKNYDDIAGQLFRSSLYEQLDGNVALDIVNILKNWQIDIAELKQMAEDPAYESDIITPSSATLLAQEYLLNVANKITPFAPLYRSAANSTLIRGRDANLVAYNKVFDRSDEWHRKNEVTSYINDPFEVMLRQNSAKNWLLAAILDMRSGPGLFGLGDNTKTGYFWWEMPGRTAGDPLDYIYIDMFKIDYDRREEGESYQDYDNRMAKFLIDYVSNNFEHPEEAIRDRHLVIPSDIKIVTLKYLQAENKFLRDEQKAREEAGDFASTDEMWQARYATNDKIAKNKQFIRDWLVNDDIPEWGESYDIRLTDWETTFFTNQENPDRTHTPTPASPWDYLIGKEGVEMALIEKGNRPNNILPFTLVEDWGGYNDETTNYWFDENTDLDAVRQFMDQEITMGRDKGKTFGEVVFGGEQPSGFDRYTNLDAPTVGHRSWVPHERKVSEEVRDLADKVLNDTGSNDTDSDNDNKGSNKRATYFPRSTYGGYSKSSRSSYSNDHPKIYSERIYNSKLSNSRVYANTRLSNTRLSNTRISPTRVNSTRLDTSRLGSERTNPDARNVNNDRAAGMTVRNPQDGKTSTYLNPRVSTKGSREAYKRQDI